MILKLKGWGPFCGNGPLFQRHPLSLPGPREPLGQACAGEPSCVEGDTPLGLTPRQPSREDHVQPGPHAPSVGTNPCYPLDATLEGTMDFSMSPPARNKAPLAPLAGAVECAGADDPRCLPALWCFRPQPPLPGPFLALIRALMVARADGPPTLCLSASVWGISHQQPLGTFPP